MFYISDIVYSFKSITSKEYGAKRMKRYRSPNNQPFFGQAT